MPDPDTSTGQGDPNPGNSTPPNDGGSTSGQQGDPDPQDNEKLKAALDAERRARREADRLAKANAEELERLRREKQEREDAEKSELQKAQERAAELERKAAEAEARARETASRTEVLLTASRLNIVDPEAAFLLLDRGALQFDEAGKPKNAEELLKELLKAKPYLAKSEDGGQSAIPGTPKPGKQPTQSELIDKTRKEMAASGRYGF